MTLASMAGLVGRFEIPFRTDEEKERDRIACEQYERDMAVIRRNNRAFSANIPSRYIEAALTSGEPSKRLLKWVDNPSDGVILTGAIGAGKTWYGCATMSAYMEKWACSGKFITSQGYIDDCLDHFKQAYFSPKILMLDDLGKEKASEYVTSCLFQLIDYRVSTHRKTIITTNYSANELLERLCVEGDTTTAKAFASRLKRFLPVKVEGGDRR